MKTEIRNQISLALVGEGFTQWDGYPYCDGLPNAVIIVPESRHAAEGAEVIAVTATTIQRWGVSPPYNYSRWRPVGGSIPYQTPAALFFKLRREVEGEKGCWGSK